MEVFLHVLRNRIRDDSSEQVCVCVSVCVCGVCVFVCLCVCVARGSYAGQWQDSNVRG